MMNISFIIIFIGFVKIHGYFQPAMLQTCSFKLLSSCGFRRKGQGTKSSESQSAFPVKSDIYSSSVTASTTPLHIQIIQQVQGVPLNLPSDTSSSSIHLSSVELLFLSFFVNILKWSSDRTKSNLQRQSSYAQSRAVSSLQAEILNIIIPFNIYIFQKCTERTSKWARNIEPFLWTK